MAERSSSNEVVREKIGGCGKMGKGHRKDDMGLICVCAIQRIAFAAYIQESLTFWPFIFVYAVGKVPGE